MVVVCNAYKYGVCSKMLNILFSCPSEVESFISPKLVLVGFIRKICNLSLCDLV